MTLVGDVILSFREQATDLPQPYPPPYLVSITQLQIPQGQFAPGNTVYFVISTIGTWGETVAGGESSVVITSPNNALLMNVNPFPNSRAIRVYYDVGGGSGNELVYEEFESSFSTGVTTQSIVVVNNGINGFPPNRSTAYNPDSDGLAVGAYAAYRWLNSALTWGASKNKGGIPAFGAAGTVSGQPLYTMPGWWKKINNAWYDGYPLFLGRHNDVFRRSPVKGVLGTLIVHEATERLITEVWPQPSRTSCQTTLSLAMTAFSNSAVVDNPAGWVLGFGKVQIENEILEYAGLQGNLLVGLTRGLAGTTAVGHPSGAPVTELNLEISGFRLPTSYSVGAGMATLLAPPGWENPLACYMLYKFRSAEQDDQAAQRFLNEATGMFGDLSANRIIAGPRQIQANAGRGAETMAGLGSPFGGVIVQ